MMKRLIGLLCAMGILLCCCACNEEATTPPTDDNTPSAEEPAVDNDKLFTIGWVSDPQWYAFAYQEILTAQNDWIVDNFDDLDMRYIIHTGDLVGEPHKLDQWEFVSGEYEKWDNAGIPYGVLAGNHDVDGTDYTEYGTYFGEARYNSNEWYGESYENNRGHYDLMTLGGVDFLFVYLGYGTHTAADIEWLNGVLQAHPTHIAMLSFHDYLKVDGTRSSAGENIFNKVVLHNPNVRAVFCGHNYNATRRVDEIDDNGDGTPDRTVFQMMANYQDLENGGNGFFRIMEWDIENGTISSKTYSPYLNTYNAFENSDAVRDEYGYQDEFVIPFDFSTPSADTDGAVGTVTVNSRVAFVGDNTFSVSTNYLNTVEEGEHYQNAGVYDCQFSLTATDAFEAFDTLNYVIVTYKADEGYRIDRIIKGETLSSGNRMVPIPQNGVVIALANDATDLDGNAVDIDTLSVGQVVTFNQVYGVTPPVVSMSKYITFPWGTDYRIMSTNRRVGGDQWILLDRSIGDSAGDKGDTHEWNVLFAFSPTAETGRYVISDTATESGVAKDLAIPENGFVLAINTVSAGNTLRQSMEDYYTIGTEAVLTGIIPQ